MAPPAHSAVPHTTTWPGVEPVPPEPAPAGSCPPVFAPAHNYYASTVFGRNVFIILPYSAVWCNSGGCSQNQALAELFTTQSGGHAGGVGVAAGSTTSANGTAFTAAICSASSQATALSFGFDNQIPAPDTCGDVLTTNDTGYGG